MKGIYLAACLARHPKYDLDYNDIDDKFGCNIICDMMQVDLHLAPMVETATTFPVEFTFSDGTDNVTFTVNYNYTPVAE